jgi:hypothetical protein
VFLFELGGVRHGVESLGHMKLGLICVMKWSSRRRHLGIAQGYPSAATLMTMFWVAFLRL